MVGISFGTLSLMRSWLDRYEEYMEEVEKCNEIKDVKKRGEEAKVAVRNIRRDANDFVKKQNKAGDLNVDQAKDEEDKVQKMTDKYIKQIDEAVDAKSKEIMTV